MGRVVTVGGTKGLLALLLGTLVVAGVAVAWVYGVHLPRQRAEEAAREQARIERLEKEATRQYQEELASIARIFDDQIANARDEATRQNLLRERARAEATARARIHTRLGRTPWQNGRRVGCRRCDPDKDPLCGI